MLASFEHVTPELPLTFKVTTLVERQFAAMWHFHPEFELTYIRSGHGTRLVGDSVSDYAPGDVSLIGPELPHTYISTPGETEHAAVVVQFRRDFLGNGFFDSPMFEAASAMLEAAGRGLSFSLPDDALFRRLETQGPAQKTVDLLSLLVTLSGQTARVLSSELGSPALNRATSSRIDAMVRFMHSEYGSPITLADIAQAAHVAPTSASRLFARATGSTISLYLTVVRINAACRLLRDSELSVSEIAMTCGFQSLSNFNRRFRRVKDATPGEYRKSFGPARHPSPAIE